MTLKDIKAKFGPNRHIDIMVLSETWLGRSTPESYNYMEEYNRFRTEGRAKGVMRFIADCRHLMAGCLSGACKIVVG